MSRWTNADFMNGIAAEELVAVLVLPGGNPVSLNGDVYQPGQKFKLRSTLADALVAQGRVQIAEEENDMQE
jgi:hypothetical protein